MPKKNTCIVAISFVCSSLRDCPHKVKQNGSSDEEIASCIFRINGNLPGCNNKKANKEALEKHLESK